MRFAYESHDDAGNWFRSYGNENWEFDEHGLMRAGTPASTTSRSPRPTGSSTGRRAGDPTTTRASATSACSTLPGERVR